MTPKPLPLETKIVCVLAALKTLGEHPDGGPVEVFAGLDVVEIVKRFEAGEPQVVLADESLAALDAAHQLRVLALLRQ